MKTNFFTFARIETPFWDSADALPVGCTDVIGIYLMRDQEATFCCSLSPSSWGEFLRNVFIFEDADAQDDFYAYDNTGLDYVNGGEHGAYFNYVDRTRINPCFLSPTTEIESDDADDADEAYNLLWDAARGAYNAGALGEPPICDFMSLRAYRRTLMLPPTSLPLFAALGGA